MIVPPQLNNFLKQIAFHFDYLFSQYRFQVIATEGDYPGFIIIESPQCRIKIYQMDGEVNLLFGTQQAPVSWQIEVGGIKHWYYIREVLNFIEKRIPTLKEIEEEIAARRTREEQVEWLSQQLKPVCAQALHLFEIDTFNQQWSALATFSQKVDDSIAKELHGKP